MKDRFKFRIWNNSEMHYNDFVVTATGYVGKITEEFLGKCVFNQEDLTADKECVLMQCTGLKDKNSRLIYEGDIVKIFHVSGTMQGKYFFDVVKWNDLRCLFSPENYGIIDDDDIYEVIGNIYENPELLKE